MSIRRAEGEGLVTDVQRAVAAGIAWLYAEQPEGVRQSHLGHKKETRPGRSIWACPRALDGSGLPIIGLSSEEWTSGGIDGPADLVMPRPHEVEHVRLAIIANNQVIVKEWHHQHGWSFLLGQPAHPSLRAAVDRQMLLTPHEREQLPPEGPGPDW